MKSKRVVTLIFILITQSVFVFRSSPVFAQGGQTWSQQQRIPGYTNDTLPPILIAGQNNLVHAFSSQWLTQSENRDVRVIMYNQWSANGGWTKPVDILWSPLKSEAQLLDAVIDDSGLVHLVFLGGDNTEANIYYSSAPISEAQDARAWTQPVVIGENAQYPAIGAVYLDAHVNIFVLYGSSIDGSSLYETSSVDGGNIWSKPELVNYPHDNNNIITNLSIYRSGASKTVAVWNEVTKEGQGRGIYYSEKNIDDSSWSTPDLLAQASAGYGTNTPAVIEYHNRVYAFYNLGGSIWQRTYDGKNDWTPPSRLFLRYTGVNGSPSLVIDGNDDLHMFFGQRMPGNPDIHGMWESELVDGYWSAPKPVVSGPRIMSGDNKSFDPFDAHAVVSQGNIILVTWRTDPGNGPENDNGVWYSYSELPIPPSPLINSTIVATPPVPTITATDIHSSSTPTISPTESSQPIDTLMSLNSSSSSPIGSLLIGIIPSVLVVSLVLIFSIYILRHKSR